MARLLVWRHGHLAAYDTATNAWSEVGRVKPAPLPSEPALPTTTADTFALGVSLDHEIFTWTGKSGEHQGVGMAGIGRALAAHSHA